MNDLPPEMTPDQFDKMVQRHVNQLGEHCLGVAIVAMRVEDGGASGVYYRTGGSHHAAEKAAEDFVERAKARRRVRFERLAHEEFDRENPPPPAEPEEGDEWKGGEE